MITQIITLENFLLVAMTSIITYIGAYMRKEDDLLQRALVNFSVFAVALIIGNSIVDLTTSTIWQLAYFVFGIMLIILIQTPVSPIGLTVSNAIVTSIVLLLPYKMIDLSVSIDLILFILNILVYVVCFMQIRKRAEKLHMNMFVLLVVGIATSFFLAPIYHLSVLVIIMAALTVILIDRIQSDNSKYLDNLQDKLDKLENEFNYELRREVNKHTFHLKEVQERMSHINKIDNLTKAFNKKAIFNIIEEMTLDRRIDQFTIIMFDLDNFKTLNDTLGHVQGDLCLKSLAAIARDCIRDTDSLGRFGGDEFLIVLPKSSLSTAVTIGERFREQIDKETRPHFTISAGLASYPEDGKTLKELLDVADKGLYRSKEKGRNAVSYDSPTNNNKY